MVQRFDHYCLWARRAIGRHNLALFTLWSGLITAAFLLCARTMWRSGSWVQFWLALAAVLLTLPRFLFTCTRATQGLTVSELDLGRESVPGFVDVHDKISAKFVAMGSPWAVVRAIQFLSGQSEP